MPISPGLKPLYDAKKRVALRIYEAATGDDECRALWSAVIEQAIFDAHVHTTGGAYPSVAWVRDARQYFGTDDFQFLCELLHVEAQWVRSMVAEVEQIARTLRGAEYDEAVVAKELTRESKYAAGILPAHFYQLELTYDRPV